MARPILSRYLDVNVVNQLAHCSFEPQGLVLGRRAGAHRSPLAGFAVEFAGHREYVAGDDPKHIDWRIFYARDKVVVKQYEMETDLVCHMVVDCSASMGYGEGATRKFTYASRLATALSYAILRQADQVSLAVVDATLRSFVTPSPSLAQIVRMAHHLEQTALSTATDFPASLLELSNRLGRREIVVIFSDFFCDLPQLELAIQRLRHQKHEAVLLQILHPDEMHFHLEGLVKFVDVEGSAVLISQTEDIRRAYLDALDQFQRSLADICHRNRCEHVVVNTQRDLRRTLLDYLHQRSAYIATCRRR